MWRQSNAWRRVGATVAAVAWVSPAASLAAYGQPGAPPAPAVAPAAAAGVDPSPPTPAASMAAFNAVDSWVREWRTPMDPSGQAPLAGASVTFRYEGSIVGRGVAFASDPAGGTGILIFAVKRAMDEAKERLPIQRDALMEESLKAAAGRMAITVELAGRPVPVSPAAWSELVELVPPGLEGVLVRIGERVEAMFPETMLCTGTDAAAAGRALVAKLSGDPALSLKEPKELREKHGVQFYRFKVSVVGQAREGKAPEFFTRGGRLVGIGELTEDGLRKWAGELAQNLLSRRSGAGRDDRLPGTIDPFTGTAEPQWTAAPEQALAALALASHAFQSQVEWRPVDREPGAQRARALLQGLQQQGGSAYDDPAAAAMIFLAAVMVEWTRGPAQPTIEVSMEQLAKSLAGAYSPEQGWREGISDAERPLIASVLVGGMTAHLQPYRPDLIPIGEAATRAIFRETPPGRLVGQMPWLGIAQDILCRAKPDNPAAPAFREMRAQLWQHQLRAEDLAAAGPDLAGGIMFTSDRQLLPTWHSARPLTYIAAMLGDPRLTEENEVPSELARLLSSLRFLKQLTVSSAEGHMYKDPARAIGGVRASLFDQRMPPEATAMTLLAVCATINSLEAIKERQGRAKEERK